MPFKTRQQKISAAARRFTYGESEVKLPTMETEKADSHHKKAPIFNESIQDISYVKKDLFKIFLLAISIVAVQIGLVIFLQI